MKADSVIPNAKNENTVIQIRWIWICSVEIVMKNLHQINVRDIVDAHGPYFVVVVDVVEGIVVDALSTADKHVT